VRKKEAESNGLVKQAGAQLILHSDAIGIGAVGALLGVALATMGGGDHGGSSTSTTEPH
jgi:hypothetical protein